tara:strand:- start:187 stop:789 length:603 start_codon:yes stop_codon:yes gene_type:complete
MSKKIDQMENAPTDKGKDFHHGQHYYWSERGYECEEHSVIEIDEETQIRPYKWTAWEFEVLSRKREGKTEYAFITVAHKWVDIDIDGDWVLVPVNRHKLLAPLFEGKTSIDEDDTDCKNLYLAIDGITGVGMCDGGYPSVEFHDQHLKDEYTKLEEKYEPFKELTILYEMGFEPYEDKMESSHLDYSRFVIKFNQRKLGE